MSTEYAGVASYPLTITIPDGSDADDAASAAVALMQLADRCEALRAGHNLVFYDATFHGATNFADGSIDATVDRVNLSASTTMGIGASEELFLSSGIDFRLQANRDANIDVLRDLLVDVTQNVVFNVGGSAAFNASGALGFGGTSADFLGGVVHFSAAGIGLGSSTSTPTEIRGQLTAQHNATFIAGKTLALNGTTSAADLTAAAFKGTVSSAVGLTFTGPGRAHWRSKELVDADFSGGPYLLDPAVADAFYLDSMAANRIAWLVASLVNPGVVIEISMLDLLPVGRTLEIYDEIGTTLLVTMSPNTVPYTRWIKKPSGGWRRLA